MFEYNLILFLVWAEHLHMTLDGVSVISGLVSASQMVHLSLGLQLCSTAGSFAFCSVSAFQHNEFCFIHSLLYCSPSVSMIDCLLLQGVLESYFKKKVRLQCNL